MAEPGRYDHLVGERGQETNLNFLRQELARVTGENQRLNNELVQRGSPSFANFLDSLNLWNNLAASGNPAALNMLKLLVDGFDRAREIVETKGKILIAKV